uniref:Apolipoprotein M n=1 Tax=Dicentrarchus labrax TaxID=13489 RepID=A0A8C4EC96_DICLA
QHFSMRVFTSGFLLAPTTGTNNPLAITPSPLTCEDLVRPLDQLDLHHLEGRRALVAGSLSDPAHLEHFKRRESASINFANETSKTSIIRVFGFGDSCEYLNSSIRLEGSGFTFYHNNLTVTVLYTSCPDCLVIRFDNESKLLRLYLFSRRREVEQKEMEEFSTQAKCLNMPPPVMMDPTKELCPEQTSSDPAAQTGEKREGQKA